MIQCGANAIMLFVGPVPKCHLLCPGLSDGSPSSGYAPDTLRDFVHLKNSGFIILSGDVVHSEENFEKNIVPSLNTNKAESIASMEKIRQIIARYKATLFINHDKKQTDKLKLLPAFYD